jgi:hypothetical protein
MAKANVMIHTTMLAQTGITNPFTITTQSNSTRNNCAIATNTKTAMAMLVKGFRRRFPKQSESVLYIEEIPIKMKVAFYAQNVLTPKIA